MKKLLKTSGILGILTIFVLICFGCSKNVEMVRPATAEEAMDLFNKYNLENNVEEMVKLYSNEYIDYLGYDANQIIKVMKKKIVVLQANEYLVFL